MRGIINSRVRIIIRMIVIVLLFFQKHDRVDLMSAQKFKFPNSGSHRFYRMPFATKEWVLLNFDDITTHKNGQIFSSFEFQVKACKKDTKSLYPYIYS